MSEVDDLRRENVLLRAIFDGALDAVLLADDEGRYIDANPAACALFAVPREQLIGRRISEFAAPGYETSAVFQEFQETGRMRVQFPLVRPDGTRRTLDASAVANVAPGVHLSVLRDITDHLAAEEKLRRSEALFRAVIEKTTEPVSLTAADGSKKYVTPSAGRLVGYSPEEMATRDLRDHILPEDRPRVAAAIEHLVRTGEREVSLAFRVQHRDGSIIWLESSGTNMLDDPDVGAIVGNYRDITARRHAVEALRASEERYRRIVENTSEGVWMYDAAGITQFMNARMVEMLGCSMNDAVGQPIYVFMNEGEAAIARARIDQRRRGIVGRSDYCLTRKDGTSLWASVKANPMFDAEGNFEGSIALVTDVSARRHADETRARLAAIVESSEDAIFSARLDGTITSWNLGAAKLFQYAEGEVLGESATLLTSPERLHEDLHILACLARGETVGQFETVRRRKDGTTVDVALTVSSLRDANGAVIGISEIVRDLSARRQAEATLRRTEEHFRQAQKMEAVGRLAGGVAHDFNNLLSVILSYVSFALDALKPGDPLRDDMEEIEKAGKRATELTQQLLAFSRQQILQPRVVDLNRIVAGMKAMLGRLLGEDIELTTLLASNLGRVLADPGQIEQVVMNLAVNARDAMPDGGKLTLETSNVVLDEVYVGKNPGFTPGDYVMLAISDTGIGMDGATRARIFEPFFTTKEKGKGTGLGLSTVFGIVEQSGGHVAVYSEPGLGCVFKVYLPSTDEVASRLSLPGPPTVQRGNETILLVEDEPQVRAVACTILRRAGYHVLETANGGEAFLVSKDFGATIHLLLTDVVMPRVSGRKLVEQLAPQRPEMRVLFASGYTDDAIVQHGVIDAGVAFLQKPFTPDALLRKVREVLDAPRSVRSSWPSPAG